MTWWKRFIGCLNCLSLFSLILECHFTAGILVAVTTQIYQNKPKNPVSTTLMSQITNVCRNDKPKQVQAGALTACDRRLQSRKKIYLQTRPSGPSLIYHGPSVSLTIIWHKPSTGVWVSSVCSFEQPIVHTYKIVNTQSPAEVSDKCEQLIPVTWLKATEVVVKKWCDRATLSVCPCRARGGASVWTSLSQPLSSAVHHQAVVEAA